MIKVVEQHLNYENSYAFLGDDPVSPQITGNIGGVFSSDLSGLSIDNVTGTVYLKDTTDDMMLFTIPSSNVGNYQITYTPPTGFEKLGDDLLGLYSYGHYGDQLVAE